MHDKQANGEGEPREPTPEELRRREELQERRSELRKLKPDTLDERAEAARRAKSACATLRSLSHESAECREDLDRLRSLSSGIDLLDPTHQHAACAAVGVAIDELQERLTSLGDALVAAEGNLEAARAHLNELAGAAYERSYQIFHAPSEVSAGLEHLLEQNRDDLAYYRKLAELTYHREADREPA